MSYNTDPKCVILGLGVTSVDTLHLKFESQHPLSHFSKLKRHCIATVNNTFLSFVHRVYAHSINRSKTFFTPPRNRAGVIFSLQFVCMFV